MITNKFNLPEVFVNVVNKKYAGSDNYTASGLNKSVRQIMLERRHRDEQEQDVVDSLWSILGSAVHNVLQSGEEKNALTEQYMKIEIAGAIFSGMSDHYKDEIISDYKFTSVWSYIFADNTAHEIQLNSYAVLFEKHGFPVKGLQIVYIFRDWNKNKIFDTGYPQSPIVVVPIKMLPDREQIIEDKIKYCEQFKDVPDKELPFCTDAERWAKPSKWAVMKENRKTAIRVFDEETECMKYIISNNLDSKHYVSERKGDQFVKCGYCSGRVFCNQYAEGIKDAAEPESEAEET